MLRVVKKHYYMDVTVVLNSLNSDAIIRFLSMYILESHNGN